jgi:hypothetical protein
MMAGDRSRYLGRPYGPASSRASGGLTDGDGRKRGGDRHGRHDADAADEGSDDLLGDDLHGDDVDDRPICDGEQQQEW